MRENAHFTHQIRHHLHQHSVNRCKISVTTYVISYLLDVGMSDPHIRNCRRARAVMILQELRLYSARYRDPLERCHLSSAPYSSRCQRDGRWLPRYVDALE